MLLFDGAVKVIVPLQIGVVFNNAITEDASHLVLVPLQIGVVFNSSLKNEFVCVLSYRPLTNRGSL